MRSENQRIKKSFSLLSFIILVCTEFEIFCCASVLMLYIFVLCLEKKREFYKNAKHVSKYKKILKQQNQHNDESSSVQPIQVIYSIHYLNTCFDRIP